MCGKCISGSRMKMGKPVRRVAKRLKGDGDQIKVGKNGIEEKWIPGMF